MRRRPCWLEPDGACLSTRVTQPSLLELSIQFKEASDAVALCVAAVEFLQFGSRKLLIPGRMSHRSLVRVWQSGSCVGTEEYERLAEHQTEGLLPIGSKGFYKACCMALVCVIGAALAAGLTMGLVSIDPMEMEIIVKTEDKDHTKPL